MGTTDVSYAGATDVGRQRRRNEDAVLSAPEHGLFAVADGMGGANAGHIASEMVVRSLGRFFDGKPVHERDRVPPARLLEMALLKANRDVFENAAKHRERHGMGSTCVAIHVRRGMVSIAHVGDSRCYRIRDGAIEQLTRDHSLVSEADEKKLTPAELKALPTNIITRAIGIASDVQVDVKMEAVKPGDAFLLCSDGLTGMLSDKEILDVVRRVPSAKAACEMLVQKANEAGGVDNISALLIRIPGPVRASEPPPPSLRPASSPPPRNLSPAPATIAPASSKPPASVPFSALLERFGVDASEVDRNLFVGSPPPPGDVLKRLGFDVLVLTAEELSEVQKPSHYPGVQVISCPLLDKAALRPGDWENVKSVSRKLAQLLAAGKKVLVTCHSGHERSCFVAAVTMVRKLRRPGAWCANQIRTCRFGALKNALFVQTLCGLGSKG